MSTGSMIRGELVFLVGVSHVISSQGAVSFFFTDIFTPALRHGPQDFLTFFNDLFQTGWLQWIVPKTSRFCLTWN